MINKHQIKVKQTLTLKDIYLYLELKNNIQKLEQLEILKEVIYNLYLIVKNTKNPKGNDVKSAFLSVFVSSGFTAPKSWETNLSRQWTTKYLNHSKRWSKRSTTY
jgi:hypothetical protein